MSKPDKITALVQKKDGTNGGRCFVIGGPT
jgi:hypothetical protein